MCSDSEKNMSAFADQNHAPSLTCVRLECMGEFNMNDGQKLPVNVSLAQSFKKLACEQPVEKITIKQITDGAGVIRPTFYHHFSDKYGLLEWILVQDILLPIQSLVENGMINEAMQIIFSKMQKEKDFYMCVGRMEGQNSFREMVEIGIRSLLTGMIEEKMKGKVPKNQWLTPERIAAYYSQTMAYIMMTWIESGMEISPEELVEVYGFMITRSLADVLADI